MEKIIKKSFLLAIVLLILLTMGSINAEDTNATDNDTVTNHTSIKTFTDLYSQVNDTEDNGILNLNESYKYDNESDNESFIEGIPITKNITILGHNDTVIDGSFLARGLNVNASCSVVLKNIRFINGYSKDSGGAILAGKNSNIIIDNCTFESNKVYNSNGGAIYGLEGSNIEINNSEFNNNSGVRVSKLAWKDYKKGMGSAICMRIGTNLTLNNTVFKNNIGYLTTILIITWDDVNTNQSRLYVKNCLFENNTARTNTVIYLDEFGIAEILDSVFRNNVATYYGGIIALDTAKSAVVKNCTFDGNTAINGGAIYINSYDSSYRSNVTIIDTNFTNNYASGYGGAIFSKYGDAEIINSSFVENIALENGGAVYSKTSTLSIANSSFDGNLAVLNGGAVSTKTGEITIVDSLFNDNSAQYGGALHLHTEKNTVDDSTFIKNSASSIGGGIYCDMEDVSSSNCKFSGNTADYIVNVYGAFYFHITQANYNSKYVKISIKMTSPWARSVSQSIKLTFKGSKTYTTKWLKTNANGEVTVKIPNTQKFGKDYVTITMNTGVPFIKSWTKIKDGSKIIYPKSVKKPNKIQLTIKNKATGKVIKNTKFTVKIYTGKTYKSYKIKTNSKGIMKINSKRLSKGVHKINIVLNNSNYDINNKFSVRIK